ncbi:unnamed protein product [Sphagnum jensenii]|uniref:Pseudouridine synthase RsuA/RluA-like domain-containing protein n=1 Tax=Sphagnum jensenii TaxID=128206 RepID=A0ABP1AMJ7_9BRYO
MEQAAWFGIPWPEFNHGLIYTDTVKYAPSASPQSLLDFYSLRYKESASKQGWLQRIRNGQIHVDGNVIVTSDSILRNGACLEYVRHPWREPEVPFRLQILFEDDHLVAVNKPSGLQVLPGGLFQQRTVLTQLQWRSDSSDKQATHGIAALHEKDLWKPSPVHRLGRGTSGVLLCAKSPAAKSQIAADLAAGTSASSRSRCEDDSEAERRITKTYRALASGIIPTDEVVVNQPIGKVRYAGVAGGLYMACAGGKLSRSRVTVLQRNLIDNQSLVEVQIFTGRPHQIRIHLAAIGHPLVGDPLYLAGGQPRPLSTTAISRNLEEDLDPADDGGYQRPSFALPGDTGYLLHAWHLSFIHPVTTERMNIVAQPPPQLCAPHE